MCWSLLFDTNQGCLFKLSKKKNSWKERFFILTNKHQVYYNQYKMDFENFFRIQEESAHKIRTKKYLFVIKQCENR